MYKYIDVENGIKRFDNETAYLKVVQAFYKHTPTLLDELRTLSKDGTGVSLAEYGIIVHGIKGSSKGIVASEIATKAEEMEKAAKGGDFDYVIAQNSSFIALVESLMQEIGELLQKAGTGAKEKEHAAAPDPALLAELCEAAKQFVPTQMEKIIEKLESYNYDSGNDLVAWLRNQFDNLEYDAIQEKLKS